MKLIRKNHKKLIFPDMIHAISPFLILDSTGDNATRMEVFAKMCTGDLESPFEYTDSNNHRKYLGSNPRKLEDETAGDLKNKLKKNDCKKIKEFINSLSIEDQKTIFNYIEEIDNSGTTFPKNFAEYYSEKLIKTLEARESHLDDDEYNSINNTNIQNDLLNKSIIDSLNWTDEYKIDNIEDYINKQLNTFSKLEHTNLSVVKDGTNFNGFFVDNQYSSLPEDTKRVKKKHIFDVFVKPKQKIDKDFILSKNNIMLVGSGGIGKSTYLRYIMLKILMGYNKYNLIPIYIQSKFYEKSCIIDALNFLESKIKKQQNFIILIDALDEVNYYKKNDLLEEVNNIISNSKNIRFIITSRSSSLAAYIINKFEIKYLYRFTIEQVQKYITNVCKVNNVMNYLDDENFGFKDLAESNEDLIRTPLFLTLIIRIYQEYKYLPKSKVEIFDYIYNLMYKNYDSAIKNIPVRLYSKLSAENMKIIIAGIAYHCGNKFSKSEFNSNIINIVNENPILKGINYDELLDDLTINIPYLRVHSDNNSASVIGCLINETYTFIYTTLYEYFVAYYYHLHLDKLREDLESKFLNLEITIDDNQILPFLVEIIKNNNSKCNIEQEIIKPSLLLILEKWSNLKSFLADNFQFVEFPINPEFRVYENRPYFLLTDFIMFYYGIKPLEINMDKVLIDYPNGFSMPAIIDNKVNLDSKEFLIMYQYPIKKNETIGFSRKTKQYEFHLYWLYKKIGTKNEKKLEPLWKPFTDPDSDYFKFYEFIKSKSTELNTD